jgi:glutamine---fructose-6-phosphate transaminase (isomerizing)
VTDRVTTLRADIEAGPAALGQLLAAYRATDGPLEAIGDRPSAIVFSGLGSSRYAALTAAAVARAAGLPAWADYASTSSRTALVGDQVLVVVSASGRTAEVIGTARRHRGRGRVIAVTNDPGSPLAAEADVVLPLLAGQEGSGIATRTFRATVAVLGMLVGRWTGKGTTASSLDPTVDAMRTALDGRDAWLGPAAGLLDGSAAIDVLGDDTDAALVHQAALMLREAPRLPAVAHETADWLHTAIYLALPGHRTLLFAGSAADAEVIATIRRRDGETIVVGPSVEGATLTIDVPVTGDPVERAIVQSVVSELLALALWERTSAEGGGP